MRSTSVAILAFACLLLSGCQAARPAPGFTEPAHAGRQLLSVNWGAFTCSDMNNIGFSTAYKALAADGVIMGNVRIHNRGQEPFSFNTPGFRLMGLGGYLDSQMKCPENEVPAGGVLQCGFVAPAVDSLAFDSFKPFFMRDTSTTPCFCQSPMSIDPFLPQAAAPTDSLLTRRIDTSFDGAKLSQDINNLVQPWLGFADAVAEAFGDSAKALSQALSKTVPDALSLAEEVADSIFNIKIGFISEDPLNTPPTTTTIVQQPTAAKPTPQAGGPSTGSHSSSSPDAPKTGGAAAHPQKPLAVNPTPVPVFIPSGDKPNAKAPTAEAPAAAVDKKDDTITAPSKPAVDASTPGASKDAPAATSVPAVTPATPTPAADSASKDKVEEPSKDAQQTPAVTPTTPTDAPVDKTPEVTKDLPAPAVPVANTETPVASPTDKKDVSKDTSQQAPAVTAPTDVPAASVPAAAAKPEDKPAVTAPTTPAPQAEAPKQTPEPAAVIDPKPAADSKSLEAPAAKPTPADAPTKTPEPTPAAADKPGAADTPSKATTAPAEESKPAPSAVQPDTTKPASSSDTPAPVKENTDAAKDTPQQPAAVAPKPADVISVRPAEADTEAERPWFRPVRPLEADAADRAPYRVSVSSEREEPERYRRGRLRSRRGYYEA